MPALCHGDKNRFEKLRFLKYIYGKLSGTAHMRNRCMQAQKRV